MFLGEYNELKIDRFTSVGAYLLDSEGNDVLFPIKYLKQDLEIGDMVTVFLYKDSEDRLVATSEEPFIYLNEFAWLECTDVSFFGAFLDWGLEKELLVPFREQNAKLEVGNKYLTYLYIDESTQRLVGTCRTNRWVSDDTSDLEQWQEVDIMIGWHTDLGVDVIVNNKFKGLIFKSDIGKPVQTGEYMKGFISNIREDGKLDIRFTKDGFEKVDLEALELKAILEKNEGFLPLTDNSSPDEIRRIVKMSKKGFKKAVGSLYKQRLILLTDQGISLVV